MIEPNKELLTDWLEGRLDGDQLAEMEAWAEENAGDLDNEFKCEIGWNALGEGLFSEVTETEEPPYPEFFNSKLQQAILAEEEEEQIGLIPTQSEVSVSPLWKRLRSILVPASIAAAAAFYVGTQMKPTYESGSEIIVEVIYVPDENVEAAISETADATEIILDGLSPIADDFDMGISSAIVPPAESSMMVNQDKEKIFY